ncbi:MAG TPA: anion permease [Ramlibacter sp.]|nr:anion permease [Ramlibacter sp.]
MSTPSIPLPAQAAPTPSGTGLSKPAGLAGALAALLVIILMPVPPGLPPAGQIMLGILAFAVIVWMSEALDYAVSSVVIGALMVFLLAYVPDAAKPAGAVRTGLVITMAAGTLLVVFALTYWPWMGYMMKAG